MNLTRQFAGPWAIGEIIENDIGVIFVWGTFVGDTFLPGAFTYAYGFFQLFSFHLPLMFILAHLVDYRCVMAVIIIAAIITVTYGKAR